MFEGISRPVIILNFFSFLLNFFNNSAKKINLKEKQIISWFTYRRRKLKLSRKQQQQEV